MSEKHCLRIASLEPWPSVDIGADEFRAASSKNAENVLVLHDLAAAQRYEREWERLWGESEEMGARY